MTEPAATEAVTDPPPEESEAAAETEASVQTEDARTEETTEPEANEKVQETEETMRISTKGRYALRLMLDLVAEPSGDRFFCPFCFRRVL